MTDAEKLKDYDILVNTQIPSFKTQLENAANSLQQEKDAHSAALQTIKDNDVAHAENLKGISDSFGARMQKQADDHLAILAAIKKEHAVELVKQKQRVDRMEFAAKQAQELASVTE